MKPHKWSKEIKHWADGGDIELRIGKRWVGCNEPVWDENTEYRIRPQPKKPQYLYVYKMMTNEGLKIQFWDTHTYQKEYIGKIKLEVDDDNAS